MSEIIQLDLGGVNSYLVKEKDRFLLVDNGGPMFMDKSYTSREALLAEQLRKNGVTKENLKLLVLTHGDCDHVYNTAFLKQTYQMPVAIGAKDISMLQNPNWDCYKSNSHFSSGVLNLIFSLMNKKIEKLMHKVYEEFKPVIPELHLKESDCLSEYGFDFTIYETKGHTKGSICLLDSEGNLLCGDLFANNKKPSLSINAENFSDLKSQASRMLALPVKKIFPGHGNPFDAKFHKKVVE